MKTKIFVTFSLVLSFGLTFGRNINNTKSGQPLSEQSSAARDRDDAWNPLAELLGLKEPAKNEQDHNDDLGDLFERHSREMEKAMKEHQEIMDKAMDEHRRVIDTVFGDLKPVVDSEHNSAMAQHQRVMEGGMAEHTKEMFDFDKDWDQFDKEMGDMFREFDRHFEQMSAPYEMPYTQQTPKLSDPQKEKPSVISEKEERVAHVWPTEIEIEKETEKEGIPKNKKGLPVFHPGNGTQNEEESAEQLPQLINNIMDGFKPVLDELQKEVEDRINATYQSADKLQSEDKGLTVEDASKSNENSTEVGLFSHIIDHVVNGFSQLGSLIFDSLSGNDNETMVATDDTTQDMTAGPAQVRTEFDRKLKIAYVLHALENVIMARITQVSFEDTEDDELNLLNFGFNQEDITSCEEKVLKILRNHSVDIPVGTFWSKVPWEVADIETDHINKIDMMENVVQIVSGRLLSQMEENRKKEEAEQNRFSAHKYIEKQLRTEFIIKKDDDDYEWYEWVIVSLIAGTSSLMLIVALFMCVQRSRHSRSVKPEIEEKDLKRSQCSRSVKPETEGEDLKAQNGIENENLCNKYKEKIQTIFVNLKA